MPHVIYSLSISKCLEPDSFRHEIALLGAFAKAKATAPSGNDFTPEATVTVNLQHDAIDKRRFLHIKPGACSQDASTTLTYKTNTDATSVGSDNAQIPLCGSSNTLRGDSKDFEFKNKCAMMLILGFLQVEIFVRMQR